MKLIRARVTNFRSVEDSEPFRVDEVTCLVGKNEAGKSSVLAALAALNPHPATPMTLDKERDYPRRYLTEYETRHPEDDAVAVTTTWALEADDVKAIEHEFGAGILKSHEVDVFRRYADKLPRWTLNVDFPKVFEKIFDRFKLNAAERAPLKSAGISTELIDALKKIEQPTEKQKAVLAQMNSYGQVTTKLVNILATRLPRFMYFSNYDRMAGAVSINHLQSLKDNGQLDSEAHRSDKLFDEFLEYAGVPIREILAVDTYETFAARLNSASIKITDQILEYWTQNPDLAVQVRIEQGRQGDAPPMNSGTVARARIQNTLHRVDTPFSERSAGFVWFFSFLVKFAQVKDESAPVVLLLDEPGLSLHGKAQGDLLRFFDEKLAPHHQIIYSTHSPFMVASDKLSGARIVEDRVEQKLRRVPIGTKVREDVLSRDPDTLFPLQGALGYEITQSLFVGKHTLLVEGPGDVLYLQALSSALQKSKRSSLDPRWTICPVGGIGKIHSFMALFGGNKLDVAVLTDFADGQKKEVERLRTSQILKAGRVLTMDAFTGKPESDIEDLFEAELFVDLLNSAYGLDGTAKLTVAKLESADPTTVRLVKKAEAYFRTDVGDFDHFKPADWLIANPSFLNGSRNDLVMTLNRAEALIKSINSFLNV